MTIRYSTDMGRGTGRVEMLENPSEILYGDTGPRGDAPPPVPGFRESDHRLRLDQQKVWTFVPADPQPGDPVRVFNTDGHPLSRLPEAEEIQRVGVFKQKLDIIKGEKYEVEMEDGSLEHFARSELQTLADISPGDPVETIGGSGILESVEEGGDRYDLIFNVALDNQPNTIQEYHRDQLMLR